MKSSGAKAGAQAKQKHRAPVHLNAMLDGGAMTGRSAAEWRVAVRRGSSGAKRSCCPKRSGAERSGTELGLCGAALPLLLDLHGRQSAASGACGAMLPDCPARPLRFRLPGKRSAQKEQCAERLWRNGKRQSRQRAAGAMAVERHA